MRKIIERKVYDTDKAEVVAEYEPHPYRSDHRWFCETLYRTRWGRWFVHGVGGPASPYSEMVGPNSWTSGERIVPMTEVEVQEWAEWRGAGYVLEDYFPAEVSEA